MDCLEGHHWFGDPFDKAVILFKDLVEVFDLPDFNERTGSREFQDRVDSLKASQIGAAFVNDKPLGNAVSCNGFLEKTPRRGQIATFRQHEIKGLAIAVDGPIQIGPFTPNLEIGLVNAPGARCAALAHLSLRGDLRRVPNNLPVQCCMVDGYPTFGQNFLKITIGNGVAHVKEYGIKDDAFGEMGTFEIDCHLLSLHSQLCAPMIQ